MRLDYVLASVSSLTDCWNFYSRELGLLILAEGVTSDRVHGALWSIWPAHSKAQAMVFGKPGSSAARLICVQPEKPDEPIAANRQASDVGIAEFCVEGEAGEQRGPDGVRVVQTPQPACGSIEVVDDIDLTVQFFQLVSGATPVADESHDGYREVRLDAGIGFRQYARRGEDLRRRQNFPRCGLLAYGFAVPSVGALERRMQEVGLRALTKVSLAGDPFHPGAEAGLALLGPNAERLIFYGAE